MSDYFNRIPNFNYVNLLEKSSIGSKIEIKNLFRRAKIRDDIFQNISFFTKYTVVGNERPDNVAQKVYGDSNLDWVVLLTNNILNVQDEWPLSERLFNEYIIEKYGSYENSAKVHHYESKRVFNSKNETVFPFGLRVPENFAVEFYDIDIDRHVRIATPSYPVTNLMYEERIQDERRLIFILKPLYLNLIFEDMKDLLPYKKGSTEFISKTLKDTETMFN
tara:strand:- start:434 stop:1093 length:660 start_codon:yes stop_codon:yes gene_type:complete